MWAYGQIFEISQNELRFAEIHSLDHNIKRLYRLKKAKKLHHYPHNQVNAVTEEMSNFLILVVLQFLKEPVPNQTHSNHRYIL
jgi:hypothetical protein